MEGDAGAQLFSTLALMFGGALLAGCAPFFMRVREAHLQTVAALGAGLLIGSALAVIVPEGFHAFAHVSAMVGLTVGGSQGMCGTAGLVCKAIVMLQDLGLRGLQGDAFCCFWRCSSTPECTPRSAKTYPEQQNQRACPSCCAVARPLSSNSPTPRPHLASLPGCRPRTQRGACRQPRARPCPWPCPRP